MVSKLRTERQWLEQDINQIQRGEWEKSQKNPSDLERSLMLNEKLGEQFEERVTTGEGVERRHKTAVHEQTAKKKHLKLRAHCTSLMEKLEEKTQELVQKQQKLDQTKQ